MIRDKSDVLVLNLSFWSKYMSGIYKYGIIGIRD